MPRPHHQILVCLNERPLENPKGSCKPRGAEELFSRLRQRVHERGLKGQIAVNSTNCLKCCPFGPTVVVWPEGEYYGDMTPERVDALLDAIEQGRPVEAWRIDEAEVGRY